MQQPSSGGIIARVYKGIYHHDSGLDDDEDSPDVQWLDLGEDDPNEWESTLQKKLQEASDNGISKEGLHTLEKLLREFRDVLCLK